MTKFLFPRCCWRLRELNVDNSFQAAANKIDSIRKIAGNLSGGGMVKALDALEDRDLFDRTEAAKKSEQTTSLLKSKL